MIIFVEDCKFRYIKNYYFFCKLFNYQLLKNTVFDNTLDYPNDLLKSITMNFIHIHYNFSISGDIFLFYWDTSDVTNITKISIKK